MLLARKKEDNPFQEALAGLAYMARHRAGLQLPTKKIDHIKIGKKTIYLDNHIPALLQDTFSNLGYEQKDGTKPVIAAKRKTDYGWHLIWNLPPGVSFNQIKKQAEFFEDAVNAWIEMEWKHGKLHMNIQAGELPGEVKYTFGIDQFAHMELPIPVGYSRTGLVVFDLVDSPHLLIGGSTGFGKTNAIRCIVHSLLPRAYIVIIDLKRLDFHYLQNHCLIAETEDQAKLILEALNQEFERRVQLLQDYRVVKVQDSPEKLPYIVLVVDELAELKSKDAHFILDRLTRLARATGISIVVGSQRTSTQVISGDMRANFVARICYKVPSPADSRVILGEDCGLAGELPPVKGRCIFRFSATTQELQTQVLSVSQGETLLHEIEGRRWEANVRTAESKIKRLKPR